jgi:hypothetical protein
LKFRDEIDPNKEKSLTITEAEFISDQIAELNKNTTYGGDVPFEFYTTYVSVVDKDGSGKRIQKGVPGITEDQLNKTLEELEMNCKFTALEAFLREAIKKFNSMKLKIDNYSRDEFMKLKGYENIEFNPIESVDLINDVLFNQDLGVIADYFKYQTYASYYGNNVLHRYGTLSKARTNFLTQLKSGNSIDQVGNELLMTEVVPTIEREKLDEIFFKVQGIQRNHQVKYNGLNKKLNEQLSDIKSKNIESNKEFLIKNTEFNRKVDLEFSQWKLDQKSLLGKLKIILPYEFSFIHDSIKSKLSE